MKAILVIDMPKNCAKCKLLYLQGIGEAICNAVDWEERPSWCPLKPLPKKRPVHYNDEIFGEVENLTNIGWNKCVEEIENESHISD